MKDRIHRNIKCSFTITINGDGSFNIDDCDVDKIWDQGLEIEFNTDDEPACIEEAVANDDGDAADDNRTEESMLSDALASSDPEKFDEYLNNAISRIRQKKKH